MSQLLEVRMPKYPDCWETCGSCGNGEVVVLEILVKPGDAIGFDDAILTLETGKVALDIPSPQAGKVASVFVAEGESVAEGQLLLTLDPDLGPALR
jgi:pyruvate/2-oxoglutarate dehydrogenase complex dihydrolipoamide acyltransferase (E2) component